MLDLQRLLHSINGNKSSVLSPQLFNLRQEAGLPQVQMPGKLGGQFQEPPSNGSNQDSESGYSSFGGDTPSSAKSHSPVTSATTITGGHLALLQQKDIKPDLSQLGLANMANNHASANFLAAMSEGNGQHHPHGNLNGHSGVGGGAISPLTPCGNPQSMNPENNFPHLPSVQDPFQMANFSCDVLESFIGSGAGLSAMSQANLPLSSSAGMPGSGTHTPMMSPTSTQLSPPSSSPPVVPKQEPISWADCPPCMSKYLAPAEDPREWVREVLDEVKQPLNEERSQLINQVCETITESHMASCNYTSDKVADGMREFERLKKEGKEMPSQNEPSRKIWDQFVSNMVPAITRVVRFCKRLPGFTELIQEDQIKLIKQGSFEVVLTRYTPLFKYDGMFIPNMKAKIPRVAIQHLPMGKFFEEQFQFAEMFNELKLNDAQVGMLTSIMIMNPNRAQLSNRKAVVKLQGLFLQTLFVYMKKTMENYEEMFQRTIYILPILREINKEHSKTLNSLKLEDPNMKLPDLHGEVFTSPD